jgi:hypothetical protein
MKKIIGFSLSHESLTLIGEGIHISKTHDAKSNILQAYLLFIDHLSLKYIDSILHSSSVDQKTQFENKSIINFHGASIYVIEKMAHGFNRLGKAYGKGFYNYDTDPPTLWPGLKVFEKRNVNIPEQDIVDRLRFAAVLGALQTSEEDAADIDPELKAYIPPEWPLSRQQAISWIDNYGEERFAARLAELAATYGARFSDPRKESPPV